MDPNFGRSGPHETRLKSGSKVITHNLNKARLHTYISPEKSFGNATHIVESPNYLTIVDTQYAIPYSQEFRAYADNIGKPIAGVIISHSHPDHYFGLTSAFSDVPSYSLPEIIEMIKKSGPTMIKESKKGMGDLVPDHVTLPTYELELGEVTVDGIRYRYDKFDNAEADTQVVIEIPDLNTVIVQDAVYNGYHPWLGEQHTDNWINMLDQLKSRYGNDYVVLVGHGDPGSPALYDIMKQYLVKSKDIFREASGNKDQIEKDLISAYPHYKGRHIIPMYLAHFNPEQTNPEQSKNSEQTNPEQTNPTKTPEQTNPTKNPVNWFEIPVNDLDRAIGFYETVFGYSLKKMPPFKSNPKVEMAWFPMAGKAEGAGGSLVKGKYYTPSTKGTMIYLLSPSGNLSNELSRVEAAGGKVSEQKRLISEEIGYMGVFIDSEGNAIAIHSRK